MPEAAYAENIAILREETERTTAYLADIPVDS
jgi:hypothetical protein